uniref:Uncharacterized protein n=1 Tax=Megaselia scalaris TaxID=36166 RepID=T1H530_MEGSC
MIYPALKKGDRSDHRSQTTYALVTYQEIRISVNFHSKEGNSQELIIVMEVRSIALEGAKRQETWPATVEFTSKNYISILGILQKWNF